MLMGLWDRGCSFMPNPPALLTAIGRAVQAAVDANVLSDSAVQADSRLVGAIWSDWTKNTDESKRRAEVEALAKLSAQDMDPAAKSVAQSLTTQQPQVRNIVRGYLR